MKHCLCLISLLAFVLPIFSQVQMPDRKVLKVPKPDIPAAAKASGLGGTVKVKVTVNRDGSVLSVDEAYGPGSVCTGVTRQDVLALREAAKLVAAKAKFTPLPSDQIDPTTSFVEVEFPSKPEPETELGETNYSAAPIGEPATSQPGSGKILAGGVISGQANKLPKPVYPPAAKAVRASGAVNIEVLIDESGKVFTAEAKSGHPLLRFSARQAACGAEFAPTKLSGEPVKVRGIITYDFVP